MTDDSLIQIVLKSLTQQVEVDGITNLIQEKEGLEHLIQEKERLEQEIKYLEQEKKYLEQRANPTNYSTEETKIHSKYIHLIITNIKDSRIVFTAQQIDIITQVLNLYIKKTQIVQYIDQVESITLEKIRSATKKVLQHLARSQNEAERKEYTAQVIKMTTKEISYINQMHQDRNSKDKEFFDAVKQLYFIYSETVYTDDPDIQNMLKNTISIIKSEFDKIKTNKGGGGGEG